MDIKDFIINLREVTYKASDGTSMKTFELPGVQTVGIDKTIKQIEKVARKLSNNWLKMHGLPKRRRWR